jgi:hypothetical protein
MVLDGSVVPRPVIGVQGSIGINSISATGGASANVKTDGSAPASGGTVTCTHGDCCCTDCSGYEGHPKCSWRRISPGRNEAITRAALESGGTIVNLPGTIQLSTSAPTDFTSAGACATTPVGFEAIGPGLTCGLAGACNYDTFIVQADGTWLHDLSSSNGSGGVVTTCGIEPAPSPTYTFSACPNLVASKGTALVLLVSGFDFTMNQTAYSTAFSAKENAKNPDGYYILIEKRW